MEVAMLSTKLRKTALAGTILVLLVALAAGAAIAKTTRAEAPTEAQGAKVRIGFVLPDLANPVIAGFRDGAVQAAKKRGWTVLVKGTSDAKGQSDAALSYIGAKVDLLAMDPIDGKAMAPTVAKANEAGIPVIAFQSKPASGKLATFIFPSETIAGNFMGNAAVEWCRVKKQNPCKVGIIEGNLGDSSGLEENAAFRKTVGRVKSIRIVGANPTDYDPARALNVATNLITANPDIDYLYAWWDQGGAAAVEAIKARGKLGEIGVSSQNGDCLNLQHVIRGYQYQDSMFFPLIQGGLLIDAAANVLAGKKVPPTILAPVGSVTTPKAKAWLAGRSKPTAKDISLGRASLKDVSADIMKRLRQARAGMCPTSEQPAGRAPRAGARRRVTATDKRTMAEDTANTTPGVPAGRAGPGSAVQRWALVRLRKSFRELGLFAALAGLWAFFAAKSEFFFTTDNINNIFLQASNVAIIAAGLTVVIIAAEIDLSIGALEALAGSVAAIVIIRHGVPVPLGILIALGVVVLAGAVSGFLTWKVKVVSFISTLAMLGIAQGSAFLLTNGQSVYGFPESYRKIGTSNINGFPTPAIIAIVVYVVLHLMLTRTKFGLQIYAVGGNAEAAAFAGIKVGRVKLLALMISGLTAGIGGLIVSSRLDAGNGLFGAGDLLGAVAAVVIGGTSLFGGVGTVVGTAIGVIIITTINNGLVLLAVPDFWQQIVIGCIIIAAMVLDQLAKSARMPAFLR
jgi:ribose transport system permease protein